MAKKKVIKKGQVLKTAENAGISNHPQKVRLTIIDQRGRGTMSGQEIIQIITQVGGYGAIALVLIWNNQKTAEAHRAEVQGLAEVVMENTAAISRLAGLVEGLARSGAGGPGISAA